MFNSYNQKISSAVNINAVSGTLVKNHTKSRFIVCKTDSTVFNKETPYIPYVKMQNMDGQNVWDRKPVVVLQAMIIGEGLFLCEIVECSDLDTDNS